jgi:hypothetical protein
MIKPDRFSLHIFPAWSRSLESGAGSLAAIRIKNPESQRRRNLGPSFIYIKDMGQRSVDYGFYGIGIPALPATDIESYI